MVYKNENNFFIDLEIWNFYLIIILLNDLDDLNDLWIILFNKYFIIYRNMNYGTWLYGFVMAYSKNGKIYVQILIFHNKWFI